MSDEPALTVVIPTLNERENVELLVPQLRRTLDGMGVRGEILVLDAGSVDGTADAAERLGARAIRLGSGYGEAIRVGLPVGIQIVGRYRADFEVLQIAHAFEQATNVWKKRPPMAG